MSAHRLQLDHHIKPTVRASMARLILPSQDTKVIRRAASDLSGAGHWHFLKEGRDRVTICGDLISHLHKIDTSTIEKARSADLCARCWMFGKDDIAINQMSLFDRVDSRTLSTSKPTGAR